ncbi:MAG: GNAT family protein [Ilumatobacteraceae bacterium]
MNCEALQVNHPIWPLFDLVVRTPRLELRYIDDAIGSELAELAAAGVHDPAFMPFALPWTDVAPPQLQINVMQWYWRCRAELTPTQWHIDLGVFVDGRLAGSTSLEAHDFAVLRTFKTGSWLGREFHGSGIGKEMRAASLHLGFAGLGATEATTAAFADNGPSLGVTASLGYTRLGTVRKLRRGQSTELLTFRMGREQWEGIRRVDFTIDGLEPCLALLT